MEAEEIEKLASLEDDHWWYRERRAILDRLLKQLGTPGRAVDIGAACGGNTLVLKENGWQATAVDFSATGPRVCRERGLLAVRGDATRLPFASHSLDLVVAFDVLEHIEDDAAAVREIHRVLRPGGKFLVAVPADPALWSAHDEAVLHHRRYTPEAINRVVADNHFGVSRMWNWNVLMRPVLKVRRNRLTGSDLDTVPPALNAALTAVIRLERYLPVSSMPGISTFLQAEARPVQGVALKIGSSGARSSVPSRVGSEMVV